MSQKVISDSIKKIINEQLTLCISELQLLQDDMSDDSWDLQAPDKYTTYQQMFLHYLVNVIGQVAKENNDEREAEALKVNQ